MSSGALVMQSISERIHRLRQFPELKKLVADPRVKLKRHVARQLNAADKLLNVDEILRTMRRYHARGELELDETRHGQEREALPPHRCLCGIRERDRLRFVVAREATGAQNVDVHAE